MLDQDLAFPAQKDLLEPSYDSLEYEVYCESRADTLLHSSNPCQTQENFFTSEFPPFSSTIPNHLEEQELSSFNECLTSEVNSPLSTEDSRTMNCEEILEVKAF